MEAKFLLALTLFCLLGSVFTAPAPTFVLAAPAATAGTVYVTGSGAALGALALGKALVVKGALIGAALAQ